MKGDSGVAGEGRVVGVPKFHLGFFGCVSIVTVSSFAKKKDVE